MLAAEREEMSILKMQPETFDWRMRPWVCCRKGSLHPFLVLTSPGLSFSVDGRWSSLRGNRLRSVDGKQDAITQIHASSVSHHSISASYSDRLSTQHENRSLSSYASVMIQEQTTGLSGSVFSQSFILWLGGKIIGNLWIAVIFNCLKWCKEPVVLNKVLWFHCTCFIWS